MFRKFLEFDKKHYVSFTKYVYKPQGLMRNTLRKDEQRLTKLAKSIRDH